MTDHKPSTEADLARAVALREAIAECDKRLYAGTRNTDLRQAHDAILSLITQSAADALVRHDAELTYQLRQAEKAQQVEHNRAEALDREGYKLRAELDQKVAEAVNQETEAIWRKWLEYIDRLTLFYDWLRDRFEAVHHAKVKGGQDA